MGPLGAKSAVVTPDLEAARLQNSIRSMESHRPRCSGCRRTPLVGEYLHRLESDRLLCGLCLSRLPEADRGALRSERVRAPDRMVAAIPLGGRRRPHPGASTPRAA